MAQATAAETEINEVPVTGHATADVDPVVADASDHAAEGSAAAQTTFAEMNVGEDSFAKPTSEDPIADLDDVVPFNEHLRASQLEQVLLNSLDIQSVDSSFNQLICSPCDDRHPTADVHVAEPTSIDDIPDLADVVPFPEYVSDSQLNAVLLDSLDIHSVDLDFNHLDLTPHDVGDRQENVNALDENLPEVELSDSQRQLLLDDVQVGGADVDQVGGGAADFNILRNEERHYPQFNYVGRQMEIQVATDNPLYDFCIRFLHLLLETCDPNDMVGMEIRNMDHAEMPVIEIPMRRASQLDPETLLEIIMRLLVSEGLEAFLDGTLLFTFHHVRLPQGRGRRGPRNITSHAIYTKVWKSFIRINADDGLCLPRAIVTAVVRHQHTSAPTNDSLKKDYDCIRMGRKLQLTRARELMDLAGVDDVDCGRLDNLTHFQGVLPDYQIVVFGSVPVPHVIFKGPEETRDGTRRTQLYFLLEENHYSVIASVAGAFGFKYFCPFCYCTYNHKEQHLCTRPCANCYASTPCTSEEKIKCKFCLRHFAGPDCFMRHHANHICTSVYICTTCYKLIDTRKRSDPHTCGEVYCHICSHYRPGGHLCFIQPAKKREKGAPVRQSRKKQRTGADFIIVFFDLECIQVKPHPDAGPAQRIHEPILCISHKVCSHCQEEPSPHHTCPVCGERERVFMSADPVGEFVDYLTEQSDCKRIICISHNGKAYDIQFVLKHFIDVKHWSPQVITQGTKILTMEYKNLKFLDSIAFIPVALAKFNATFGLKDIAKGHFPHLLGNVVGHSVQPGRLEETNYILENELPPLSAYDPDRLYPKEREELLNWYNSRQERKTGFNFVSELVEYCRNDVHILRLGCLNFRKQFIEIGEVDPFLECVTIASSCNLLFRRQFLKPETIGIIPSGGYRRIDNQSQIAVKWLAWEEQKRGIEIAHAENGREIKVIGLKVDGYHHPTRTVFEFFGCYYHSCPTCVRIRHKEMSSNPGETAEMRFQSTMARVERLKEAGYTVIAKWEHEFNHELRTDSALQDFVNSRKWAIQPLDPRDSFYGGRTNAMKLYHRVVDAADERVHYLDVCSLYPYVNKYGCYPVGHPKIHLNNFPSLDTLEGFIRCTVLPPSHLFHPVLPYRLDGKLLFPLCRTCSEDRLQETCPHDTSARELTGTWVIFEVRKALELGYVITETFEIWGYETVRYDRKEKKGGLFASYIDTFLRLKQESSGWPAWCSSEDDKTRYLELYRHHEGIELDPQNIQLNPGRRSLAKLALNSFWGKFGQRSNLPKCDVITDPDRFYELLLDPDVDVKSLLPVNEKTMIMKWQHNEGVDVALPHTNVAIAAFTTAHARLKLYTYLEQLGPRVLYMDTDSIIFTSLPGEVNPPTGDYLGDLTDELSGLGEGAFIEEFASGGPKNYGFTVRIPATGECKTIMKVKGFRLDEATRALINFNVLKQMLGVGEENKITEAVTVHHPHRIQRLRDHTVISRGEVKTYRIVYDKRRRTEDYNTLPFGYV